LVSLGGEGIRVSWLLLLSSAIMGSTGHCVSLS